MLALGWARNPKKITDTEDLRRFLLTHFPFTDCKSILSRIRVVKQLVYASVGEKCATVPCPGPRALIKIGEKM